MYIEYKVTQGRALAQHEKLTGHIRCKLNEIHNEVLSVHTCFKVE